MQIRTPIPNAHLLGEQVAQALLQALVLVLAPPHLVLPLHVAPLQVGDRARALIPLRARPRGLRLGRRLPQPRLQRRDQCFWRWMDAGAAVPPAERRGGLQT